MESNCLLYKTSYSHPVREKTILKQLFFKQNIKKAGMNLKSAYISCPQDAPVDQWFLHYRYPKPRSNKEILWSM